MKSWYTKGFLLMIFGIFGSNSQASPEMEFWKWFSSNEEKLFSVSTYQESILNNLSTVMSKVNSELTFEFGPVHEGRREFVISAGGVKSAFPAVESLYKHAPTLRRWEWVKFRPRRTPLNDIEFAGKLVRVEDVHYLLARDDPKIGIVIFFDGYSESEANAFGQIGYLMLDEALGEYAVEMKVGFIEFHSRESKYFQQASPFVELPSQFDELWASRQQ